MTLESTSSDFTVMEDVVTDVRAIESEVEAAEVLISELVDLEDGALEGAASEATVTKVVNAGNCGGDGRPDRAICPSIFF